MFVPLLYTADAPVGTSIVLTERLARAAFGADAPGSSVVELAATEH